MGRNVHRKFDKQCLEFNVTIERTPLVTLAAAPHWATCMIGSMSLFTTLSYKGTRSDSLLACHKRKRSAEVSLNFVHLHQSENIVS